MSPAEVKEVYRKYVFEGGCPCCFPYWEYPEISVAYLWNWQDEFDAFAMYEEIMREYDDEVYEADVPRG